VRSHIGTDVNTPAFVRSDLEKIGGIDTRTARTLESLPQSRDTLTTAINDLTDDTNAIEGEPYLLFDDPKDPILTNTRKLIGSDNVSAAVGATEVQLDLSDTGVAANTYGAATKLIVLAIDAKGRVTNASEVTLNSDNVAEGTTHLYFTDARARGVLSPGSHIDYDSGTGVISFNGTGISTTVANPTSVTVVDGLVSAIS